MKWTVRRAWGGEYFKKKFSPIGWENEGDVIKILRRSFILPHRYLNTHEDAEVVFCEIE